MGNFFASRYQKEGPGVSKDAPQKKRVFVFFDVYTRKFGKIILVGLLYLLCCIPVITFGPASCGLALVLRNFAREEHAFVWHDFFVGFKMNWKQGLLLGVINLLAFFMVVFALWYYYDQMAANSFFVVLFAICLLCLLLVLFMTFYIYTLTVTFDLPIKKLLKNSAIFALLGIRANLITTLCCLFLIVLAVLLFIAFPALTVLIPVFILPTMFFVIAFNTYPQIKKFLIDPYIAEHPQDENVVQETVFSDELLVESAPKQKEVKE